MPTEQELLDRMVPRCDEAPHRAIIWVEAEVHELTRHGECSGSPRHSVQRFPVYVDGADKFITIRKLNEVLESLKTQCPAK